MTMSLETFLLAMTNIATQNENGEFLSINTQIGLYDTISQSRNAKGIFKMLGYLEYADMPVTEKLQILDMTITDLDSDNSLEVPFEELDGNGDLSTDDFLSVEGSDLKRFFLTGEYPTVKVDVLEFSEGNLAVLTSTF